MTYCIRFTKQHKTEMELSAFDSECNFTYTAGCTALHCTAGCAALHCTALQAALHCTAGCTALHCRLHCTALPQCRLQWQTRASTKGEITKSFFPITKDRISKSLHKGINLSTIITGHGTLRSYYHRFKIINDPKCVCEMSPQTTDHLLWECELLRKQREVLKNSITKAGGDWSLTGR